jgi:hypothetical protein
MSADETVSCIEIFFQPFMGSLEKTRCLEDQVIRVCEYHLLVALLIPLARGTLSLSGNLRDPVLKP